MLHLLVLVCFASSAHGLIDDRTYTSHYFDELGILVEPIGLVVSTSELQYLTVHISVYNSDLIVPPKPCEGGANPKSLYKLLKEREDIFWDTIPRVAYNGLEETCADNSILCSPLKDDQGLVMSRQPRFVGLVLGAMGIAGLGMSGYNMYRVNELKDQFSEIQANQDEIAQAVETLRTNQGKLAAVTQTLLVKLDSKIDSKYNAALAQMCAFANSLYERTVVFEIHECFDTLSIKTHEALAGKLNEFVLQPDDIRRYLAGHEIFRDSIYMKDIGSFYKLSTVALVGSNRDKKTLTFVVSTPVIKETDLSPLYKVYSGGWGGENGAHYSLVVPQHFYLIRGSSEVHALEVDLNLCTSVHGVWFCQETGTAITEKGKCINDMLFKNETSGCGSELRHHLVSKVMPASSGLLIVGRQSVKKYVGIKKGIARLESEKKNGLITRFYPYTQFQKLQVDDVLFNTRSNEHIVVRRTPNVVPTLTVSQEGWFKSQPVDSMPLSDVVNAFRAIELQSSGAAPILKQHFSSHGYWYVLTISLVVILMGVMMIRIYWKRVVASRRFAAKFKEISLNVPEEATARRAREVMLREMKKGGSVY